MNTESSATPQQPQKEQQSSPSAATLTPQGRATSQGQAARRVYLASRYSRHSQMREVRDQLNALGYEVTARWIEGGHELSKEGSTQAHEQERTRFAMEDWSDMLRADWIINFTEEPRTTKTRGGRHVEFGGALALGKRVSVVGWRENVFHCLPQVEFFPTWNDCRAVTMPVSSSEAKPNGVSASAPNSASPSLQIGGSTKALEESNDNRNSPNHSSVRNLADATAAALLVEIRQGAEVERGRCQSCDTICVLIDRAGQPDTQEQSLEEQVRGTVKRAHNQSKANSPSLENTAHEGRSESEESGENCEYCKQPLSGVENDRGDTICGKCRADIAESLE